MEIQRIAKAKYALWLGDPFHPSLQFKQTKPGLWSVRITDKYRALARKRGEIIFWFWIGTHTEYDRLIQSE